MTNRPKSKRNDLSGLMKRGYNCQEAAHYLGIKRRAFEKYFRPLLTGTRIGTSIDLRPI